MRRRQREINCPVDKLLFYYFELSLPTSLILAMLLSCDCTGEGTGYCISQFILIGAAAIVFIMLLTILILSICLCRACKRTKKQKLTESMVADHSEEADLHYAELQNLPTSNRGQCDGETCKAPVVIQNSDYATVAELKSPEDGCCNPEQKEDDEVREKESLVEAE